MIIRNRSIPEFDSQAINLTTGYATTKKGERPTRTIRKTINVTRVIFSYVDKSSNVLKKETIEIPGKYSSVKKLQGAVEEYFESPNLKVFEIEDFETVKQRRAISEYDFYMNSKII